MRIYFACLFVLSYVYHVLALSCCCDIIQSAYGLVGAGNRTIFHISYPDSFDICLVSEVGDADLYVSDKNPNPSYDPDSYTLHSATCGEDIVHIHKKLKRPIYVSIFGHPSYEVTRFYLNIVARESTEEDTIDFELLDIVDNSIHLPSLKANYELQNDVAGTLNNTLQNEEDSSDSANQDLNQASDGYDIPGRRPDDMDPLMWYLWKLITYLNFFLTFM